MKQYLVKWRVTHTRYNDTREGCADVSAETKAEAKKAVYKEMRRVLDGNVFRFEFPIVFEYENIEKLPIFKKPIFAKSFNFRKEV